MKQNIYDNPFFFKKYKSLREAGFTFNDFVEQPAIKSIIANLTDKSVLDLGCGTGHFSMYCVENGASKVMGVDISRNMIEQAEMYNKNEKIDYMCVPIEELNLPNQKFDLITSSLVIHYIEDYSHLIKKISGLLKNDGEFIFSTEHPIVTARKEMNNWFKDNNGNRLHWALDNYQEEGKRKEHWWIDGVVKYHRTISTLINTLIDNDLVIEKIIEPESTPTGLEKMPELINEKRRPSSIIIKSRKY